MRGFALPLYLIFGAALTGTGMAVVWSALRYGR